MATSSFNDTFRLTNEGIGKFISDFNEKKTVKVIHKPSFVKSATKEDIRNLINLSTINIK